MLYYIIYNGQQVGPMPKEELVKYGLNPGSNLVMLLKFVLTNMLILKVALAVLNFGGGIYLQF